MEINLPNEEFNKLGMSIAELGVKAGFGKTLSEVRRAIQGGAIKIGDIKVTDPFARVIVKDNVMILIENGS